MSDALPHPSRRALLAGAAAALALPPVAQALTGMGLRSTGLGDLTLTTVDDGRIDMPVSAFPNLAAYIDPGATRTIPLSALCWLVETPTRTVLIDSGCGKALHPEQPDTGEAVAHLRAAGLAPGDVTDVVLTHLHPDHAGGLLGPGGLAWPEAQLHVAEAEWRHWADRAATSATPEGMRGTVPLVRLLAGFVGDRLVLHDLSRGPADLGEGLTLEPAPGHSPGHAIVGVAGGGRQALLLGDALVSAPAQLSFPQVVSELDLDPDAAAATRARLFDRIASDGLLFSSSHLTTLALGQLRREGQGYAFQPA